jgi:biopolymer transport protein ExbB
MRRDPAQPDTKEKTLKMLLLSARGPAARVFCRVFCLSLCLALAPLVADSALAQGTPAQQAAPAGVPVQVQVPPAAPGPEGFLRSRATITPEQAAAAAAPPDTLLSLYRKGGVTMYFILFCSILALAIVTERFWNLRKSKIISTAFLEEIKRFWYRRATMEAIDVCEKHDIAISRILRAGLVRFELGLEQVENAIETAGQHEATLLRKNLVFLGFLANVAPMLGLFGTVLGMIKSFDAIARYGTSGNPGLVASGIAEALITTAYGLMVGIPALAAYYYFKRKVDMRVFEMEEIAVNLMQDLAQWQGNQPSAAPRAAAAPGRDHAQPGMEPRPGVID